MGFLVKNYPSCHCKLECDETAVDHTNIINASNPVNSGIRDENVNAVDIIEIVDVDDQYEDFDHNNENPNRTSISPSQGDQLPSGIILKCKICDFVSGRQTSIKDHKDLCHNWCSLCYSKCTQ